MAKKDEFYTMFYDIESEIEAYLDYNPDVFRGKTASFIRKGYCCNCLSLRQNPRSSTRARQI